VARAGASEPWSQGTAESPVLVVTAEAAASEHSLTRAKLPDAYRRTLVRMLRREVAVDRLIVLTIVTDQQPLDARKLRARRSKLLRLCSRPLRNQLSAVGPQSVSSNAARRIEGCVTGSGSRWRDVPGSGR
jgi:hypothetical protein